jgi:hypothetical protein
VSCVSDKAAKHIQMKITFNVNNDFDFSFH